MTDWRSIPPPDPSHAPSRQPGDFTDEPKGHASPLAAVGEAGRKAPGEWQFVAYTPTTNVYDHRSWVNQIRRGERSSLGGPMETWDAEVRIVELTDGTRVGAKYVACLGYRSPND